MAYTEYIYDSRGRIDTVTEQISASQDASTQYYYIDDGSLERVPGDSGYHTVIEDAEGKRTGIKLSYHGKPEIITYPSTDYKEYIYYDEDPYDQYDNPNPLSMFNGLLEKKAVWDGSPPDPDYINYDYDEFGKVKTITYPDGGYLEYDYTARILGKYGKVKQITDCRNESDRPGAEGSTFTCDYWYLFEKVKSYEDYEGYTVHYDYLRAYGRQSDVQVIDPYEVVIYHVKNSYDLAGRLTSVHEPLLDPEGEDDLIAGFDYDDNGNRSQLTYYRNGSETGPTTSIDYGYNLDNLLTDFTTTGGPTFSFDATDSGDIDGIGRLKNADETITTTSGTVDHSYTFDYDMRSQLIEATITNIDSSDWNANYTYRKDGNLDTRQETGMAQPATFDYDFQNPDDGDIMTGATGGETFALGWDWNGNMTSTTLNDGLNFTYNWDNKLRKVEQGMTVVMSVKYDPDGNRIFKDSSESGERKYIVDITGKLPVILMELDSADNMDVMKKYIYAHGQVLAQHDIDDDALPAKDDMYFYLHDRLGSVRQVIDNSASMVKYYTYQSFGETIEDGGTFDNPFQFAGQYFDSEIKEYYLRARQYNPHIARFTSRDPVFGKFREPMTLHVYLYCLNDPINRTDPSGELSYAGLFTSMAIGALQGSLEWYKGGSPYDVLTGAVAGGVGGLTGAWLGGAGLMAKIMTGAISSVATVGTEHLLEWDSERLFADMLGAGMVGGALGGMGELLGESFAGVDIGRQWIPLNAREFLDTLGQNTELYDELVGVTGSVVWDALLETYRAFK